MNYFIKLIVLSFVALGISFGLYSTGNSYFATSHFWIPIVFFFITTLATNKVITSTDKQSQEFVFKTLAISMARLLVCMIAVFVYSLINKPEALTFTCHFMIQYVLFTIFEHTVLLKHVKKTD